MANAKLEGLLTVPSTYVFVVNSGADRTMTAQDTYLSSVANGGSTAFVTNFQTLCAAAIASTTVALSATTGKITITWGTAITSLTWTSTALRDRLGFTGNLGAGASHTGSNQCQCLWLPGMGSADLAASLASTSGSSESDLVTTVSRSGVVWATQYNERFRQRLRFAHLLKNKVWSANESITNESAYTFWSTIMKVGAPLRYYPDATDQTNPQELVAMAPNFEPQRDEQGTDILWTWGFDAAKYVHSVTGGGV